MANSEPMNRIDQVRGGERSARGVDLMSIVFLVVVVAAGLGGRVVSDRWPGTGWWPLVAAVGVAWGAWLVMYYRRRR